jgi:hypothetical protein
VVGSIGGRAGATLTCRVSHGESPRAGALLVANPPTWVWSSTVAFCVDAGQ